MSEFRRDPISGRWVIIAEERGGRPSEFLQRPARRAIGPCPFCPENESATPQAVAVYPRTDAADPGTWGARVIPNKYPAASLESGDPGPELATQPPPRIDPAAIELTPQSGLGIHEVVVESPRHVDSLAGLTDGQVGLVMKVYRDRLAALSYEPSLRYAVVFKNCRGGGGATLEHVHSQLLGTCFIPVEVELELQAAARYYAGAQRCLFCELCVREEAAGNRIVQATSGFLVFCPYASRFPFETWIVPRRHQSRFEESDPAMLEELGTLVRRLLMCLERESAGVAYNYWIRSAPYRTDCEQSFHWRMELIPRTTTPGGYEWGTGSFVNPVAPETAARRLR